MDTVKKKVAKLQRQDLIKIVDAVLSNSQRIQSLENRVLKLEEQWDCISVPHHKTKAAAAHKVRPKK